jgi:hypothetical protein
MSQAASPSSGKEYGLARVCKVWNVPRSTVYLHRIPPAEAPRKRGPK